MASAPFLPPSHSKQSRLSNTRFQRIAGNSLSSFIFSQCAQLRSPRSFLPSLQMSWFRSLQRDKAAKLSKSAREHQFLPREQLCVFRVPSALQRTPCNEDLLCLLFSYGEVFSQPKLQTRPVASQLGCVRFLKSLAIDLLTSQFAK